MRHTIDVPDIIWEWAQRKSGKINPASWIRESCLYAAMIEDIGSPGLRTPTANAEAQWAVMGMELDPIDTEFHTARDAFVAKIGGDDKAIAFLSKPSLTNPRAWLIDWWRKQGPQAV